MGEHDSASSRDDQWLQSLRGWLHSEMSTSQPELMTFGPESRAHPPEQEGVQATIRVQNEAPASSDGGEVVFVGVGLHISDGRKEHTSYLRWVSTIKTSRPSDRPTPPGMYRQQAWFSRSQQMPAETSGDKRFGEVLFPGESVVYEMRVPTADLPYTNIQVEGTVSRRHLFHCVQRMKGLERWTRPLLVETLRALDAINIHRPLLTATNAIPELGPQTTLADLETFRTAVGKAQADINQIGQELNKVFHSAPDPEFRQYMKEVVGRYLASVQKTGAGMLEALSSGDTERMRIAAGELRHQLIAAEEVKQERLRLMSRLGVAPDEVGTP